MNNTIIRTKTTTGMLPGRCRIGTCATDMYILALHNDEDAGVALALPIRSGSSQLAPASGTKPMFTNAARKYAERAAALLDRRLTWAELTPGKILYLVRTLARSSTDGTGARSAEYTCVVLYAVAAWLRQEKLIPESAAVPSRGWKTKVKEEWCALTGRRVETATGHHIDFNEDNHSDVHAEAGAYRASLFDVVHDRETRGVALTPGEVDADVVHAPNLSRSGAGVQQAAALSVSAAARRGLRRALPRCRPRR